MRISAKPMRTYGIPFWLYVKPKATLTLWRSAAQRNVAMWQEQPFSHVAWNDRFGPFADGPVSGATLARAAICSPSNDRRLAV
jgi:hypothetical protein